MRIRLKSLETIIISLSLTGELVSIGGFEPIILFNIINIFKPYFSISSMTKLLESRVAGQTRPDYLGNSEGSLIYEGQRELHNSSLYIPSSR